jgi:hypothetical protein
LDSQRPHSTYDLLRSHGVERRTFLGQAPGRVRIAGVEPARVRTGIEMSAELESALPHALAAAKRVLAEIGREENVSGDSRKNR